MFKSLEQRVSTCAQRQESNDCTEGMPSKVGGKETREAGVRIYRAHMVLRFHVQGLGGHGRILSKRMVNQICGKERSL